MFKEINYYLRHVCSEEATLPSFYYKRLHRHLYFNNVYRNPTTRKREQACRVEIYRTSSMISLLSDEQKYTLITYVLDRIEYDRIIDLLYPPDEVYSTIMKNEEAIQNKLKAFIGSDQEIRLDGISSYKTEVLIRRNLLNRTFRQILEVNMNHIQMCINGESYKCKLIGLIKRTVDYRTKNKTKCDETNDGTCYITPTANIILHDILLVPEVPPSELYQDYLHDYRYVTPNMIPYYETFLYESAQGLVPWSCEVPPIEEEESDGE
ncbi:uncharacterized protein LOC126847016 isoform X2 [Adelges cooleyi]|uniref:uncharacterized protein LOC126847016 isoform X2 n=1 Tax=Adelges cooleyi TaxID=133065 RepID=UPI002180993E|nr:uncharacterized protein LOC126847016 isoform X2 [Adelges cooleyi]